MGIWDKIRGEFIDIIEWTDDSNDTMLYRFERHGNEIKNNAKLTVREGQQAVFVNEGQIADVFSPGMYTLSTENLPILATLKGWKYGFSSPFKAEVYFVSTRRFRDLKWGTKNPIMIRDPEVPSGVEVRAFGTYTIRINDGATFIREIAGTDGHFTTDELVQDLRNKIVSRFADAIGESGLSVLDMASNYDELGEKLRETIDAKFDAYGVDLLELLVENISLPEELRKIMRERMNMDRVGDLNRYQQFKTAQATEEMAKNEGMGGGMAAGGMGMGMGYAMANQMSGGMQPNQQAPQQQAPAGPPPVPQAVQFFLAVNGQQQGPFDTSGLKQKIQSGELTAETLVWKQGMANWMKASEVGEVSGLFGAAPPPIPPSA